MEESIRMEEPVRMVEPIRIEESPILVNMLVKFIHVDCWGPLRSRCQPQLVAVTLDVRDFAKLHGSLEGAISRRILETHFQNTGEANNVFYDPSYAIEWAGHEEVQSADLRNINYVYLRNQFCLIKDRGSVDVLVIRYQYHDQQGLRQVENAALNINQTGGAQLGDGQGSNVRPSPLNVRDPTGFSPLPNGIQDYGMPMDIEEDSDASIHRNGHSGPRGEKITLRSPRKIGTSQENSPSGPIGLAIRPMNNGGVLQDGSRSVNNFPDLSNGLGRVGDAEEKSNQNDLADNETTLPFLRPSSNAGLRPASMGSNSSTASNNYKPMENMRVRIRDAKQTPYNRRVASGSTLNPLARMASVLENPGTPMGSRQASIARIIHTVETFP